MADRVAEAVEAGDLDGLVRLVDGLCSAREWTEVVRLRDRCRHAVERGLQLWPAAEYAEYRLALHGPGRYAGPVIREGAGRFALGPLWEVAASTHTWADLADHLPAGPARSMVGHERVIRGEDLSGEPGIDALILELPLRLEDWEPSYPVASYRAAEADFPAPSMPTMALVDLPAAGKPMQDRDASEALFDLGKVWAEQSNGFCRVEVVQGIAEEAIAALGHRSIRLVEVDAATACGWMAWAAASGGAYGRRRGTPVGRFSAWWTAATLTRLEWPADPDRLGRAAGGLRWVLWEPPGLVGGWSLNLAVEDPGNGSAWVVEARDTYRDDDPDRPGLDG